MSTDTDRFKRIIKEAAQDAGLRIQKWNPDDDDRPVASLGRFLANADDDNEMYFEGDEGEIEVTVVGAQEFNNERPYFSFRADGLECGEEIKLDALFDFEAI